MDAWLTPVHRDTFVFHIDSIPDTLKSKVEFRSFYSPAAVLEDETPPGSSVPATNESLPADTTAIIHNDTTSVRPNTLSITPKTPPAVVLDSIKAPKPSAPVDST